jgi:hypothetical protein
VGTLAELRDYMQECIASIGEEFTEPDDDWMSIACLEGDQGQVIIGLSGDLFANGFRKDLLAQMLKQAMVEYGAYRYAVLFNTHTKTFASEDEVDQVRQENVRISQLEGAREMLVLVVGDAEQEDCWMTYIERDGQHPPTLAEWKEAPSWSGRFSGLNEQMQAIR